MAAREYLRVTPETTPGTYASMATPVLIDIDSTNAYTMRPAPIRQTIRTAGALNRRLKTISRKTQFQGNLNWTVRGSQAALLTAWCLPTAGVLTSYTVDHVIVQEDSGATKLYSRHLGVYVAQAQFTTGEQDQWFKAQLQLVGMNKATITVTDFAEPAITDYPTDPFLTFEDAAAGLTLHSASRVDIETFNLTIKNMLDVRFFVATTPQKIKFCGRDVDWTSRVSMLASVPRTDFEAQTPIAGGITFNNGTNSLAFQMHTQNYYASVTDDLDQSKVFLQEISLEAHMDTAAASDFDATAT